MIDDSLSNGESRERTIDGYRVIYDRETAIRMGGIRQRDTTPEVAVRRALTKLGLRYRVRNRDLTGSPDIANRKAGWAIFVHGCYWHRHRACRRATMPKRNAAFWRAKFDANVMRDRRARARLRRAGFDILTVWECEAAHPDKLLTILSTFAIAVRLRIR